jgi:hypothetical protein
MRHVSNFLSWAPTLIYFCRGRIVDLATNCYGCHVLQKALDCEEDIRLLIVSELLLGDPAQTLVNKHASHVWSKVLYSIVKVQESGVFNVALLDHGIVLDSARASDFHLVSLICSPFLKVRELSSLLLVSINH